MAKILWPGGAKVSGSTGATTYQRNGIQRSRSSPRNPQSIPQTRVRANLSSNAALWRTLTDQQRSDWKARSLLLPRKDRLGNDVFLTGFQRFVADNGVNLAWGFDLTLDAPPVPSAWGLFSPIVFEAAFQPGPPLLKNLGGVWDYTINGAGDTYILIEATPPLPSGIAFVRPRYRLVTISPLLTAGANVLNFNADYDAVFGGIWTSREGENIFVRLTQYSNSTTIPLGEFRAVITDSTP